MNFTSKHLGDFPDFLPQVHKLLMFKTRLWWSPTPPSNRRGLEVWRSRAATWPDTALSWLCLCTRNWRSVADAWELLASLDVYLRLQGEPWIMQGQVGERKSVWNGHILDVDKDSDSYFCHYCGEELLALWGTSEEQRASWCSFGKSNFCLSQTTNTACFPCAQNMDVMLRWPFSLET